jgi:hypothetical protein
MFFTNLGIPLTVIRLPEFIGVDMSSLPQPTWPAFNNTSNDWTFNFAPGTRLDCYRYANGSDFGANISCDNAVKGFGVSVEELKQWNPSLNSSCTLSQEFTYCSLRVTQNAPDMTKYCIKTDVPRFNATCTQFRRNWALGLDLLSAWNPRVGPKCENWKLGQCVPILQCSKRSTNTLRQRLFLLRRSSAFQAEWHRVYVQPVCKGKFIQWYIFTHRSKHQHRSNANASSCYSRSRSVWRNRDKVWTPASSLRSMESRCTG